ncbi:MAG: membrane dipeptidase, partial [Dethiobacter sp.]|nr:membrane dipeptidase [Dethiobacter sp.]
MPAYTEHIIADCHCDTLWHFNNDSYRFTNLNPGQQVDLPRLLEGRVRILFFAICVAAEIARPFHFPEALRYIALYLRCLAENRSIMHGIETAADLNFSGKDGSVGCLLALEGAEPLAGSPELLDLFYQVGVRSVALTWNKPNRFAYSCAENSSRGGLRRAGRKLIGALAKK